MEKTGNDKWKDAVLTAGLVIAALAIYLLSGDRLGRAESVPETPLPTEAAAVSAAASPTPAPPGVPPDSFLSGLAGAGASPVPAENQPDTYRLHASPDGDDVLLTLSLSDGRLTGWTLAFPALRAPESTNPESAIEQALSERAERDRAKRADSVRAALLAVSGSALGAAHAASYDTVMRWHAGALDVLETGKPCEIQESPGTFRAFLSETGTDSVLYCTLTLAG